MRDVAEFYKVFSDEARLKIVWLLCHQSELCVCDIMGVLKMTQSKASRHLGTLKRAGLVRDRKEGLWSYYALAPGVEAPWLRAQLELLRQKLCERTDAAALLMQLHGWLSAKARGMPCRTDANQTSDKPNSTTSVSHGA